MRKLLIVAILSLASLPAGAGAVDSMCRGVAGKWRLDFSQSHIGKEKEVPSEVIAEISYARPEFHVRLSKKLRSGTDVADYLYFTNGQGSTNVAEGLRWKSEGVRESGRALLLEQTSKVLLFRVDVNDRWTLSPDGKVLTIDRSITSVPRKEKILYVFRRQG